TAAHREGRARVISVAALRDAIAAPPPGAARAAERHLDTLTKPPGSLGRLEELAARLVALTGAPPRVAQPVIFAFAADHGVVAEGVSAYPPSVTAQMVENFLRGGAAVNVLARDCGARVVVADFGVANPIGDSAALVRCSLGAGTANIARGPAMTRERAEAAIEAGPRLVMGAIDAGADLVAATVAPASVHAMFASHRSAEPGHTRALAHLGLVPYLDLGLRLGEGTGAALFVHLARAAARVYTEMATFKSAGVDGPA